jgi:hypothetical protein
MNSGRFKFNRGGSEPELPKVPSPSIASLNMPLALLMGKEEGRGGVAIDMLLLKGVGYKST